MKYIIIGLGNFGTNLGLRLRDLDHEVIGIDTRESIVEADRHGVHELRG